MSFRYRVIRDGRVVGSIPCADGYYGQSGIAFNKDGTIQDLRQLLLSDQPRYLFALVVCWIDQDARPVGSSGHFELGYPTAADIARFEIFVDAYNDEQEAILHRVDGWESVRPERIIDLGERTF